MANELKPCPFCQCEPKLVRPMGDRLHNDKPPYYGPEKYRYSCSSNTCCVMTNCHDTEEEARTQWNTRPAAPVEGLETVNWPYQQTFNAIGAAVKIQGTGKAISVKAFIEAFGDELVTRSQAEAIIAEERADYEAVLADYRRLTRLLDVAMHGKEGAAKQASLCDLIEPAKQLRADNAALTERVKELEGEVFPYPELGITWKQICEKFDKECTHRQELSKALETQLAAARKALEDIKSMDAKHTHELRAVARAALEVKP